MTFICTDVIGQQLGVLICIGGGGLTAMGIGTVISKGGYCALTVQRRSQICDSINCGDGDGDGFRQTVTYTTVNHPYFRLEMIIDYVTYFYWAFIGIC
ncbi:hypothetical protein CJ030_MR4G009614 [Morella rubra]|uniref:Uncharacterized protein n=1 Tax=Morella rubra TaxID=262757 RepID=A0A6A1VZN8_9ROSI|nr:hypothetical protein CJ030_MR4G009614 [Morella rubra]